MGGGEDLTWTLIITLSEASGPGRCTDDTDQLSKTDVRKNWRTVIYMVQKKMGIAGEKSARKEKADMPTL